MDSSKKEGTLSCQCSVNSEGKDPNDILWLRTKYKLDQNKVDEVKSILIVDEGYLTKNLQSILEDSNLHVDTVQSGVQALRMIINKHYDIVVMEANLPGLKGGEMAQIIKSMSPDTKVVLMTRDEYWDETLKGATTDVDEVKSILIVDEDYLTKNLQSILEDSNLQVDTVQSGVQALRMIINKHYDVVVMEANLPGLKGGEMAQIIKSMSTDTKVVLMTRDEYWDENLRGATTEVDEVLIKPFAPEELIKVIRRITERNVRNSELIMKLPFA
jgi:DNA-binding response OmpR family regulator